MTAWSVLAVAGSVVAVLLFPRPRRAGGVTGSVLRPRWGRWAVLSAVLVLGSVAVAGLVVGAAGRFAVAATVFGLTCHWLVRSHRRRVLVEANRTAVSQGCQALAGLLLSGALPTTALLWVAEDFPVLEPAAAAQRVGADVVAALDDVARRPGCDGVAHLAAAWQLAERSGAPIAALVSQVAEEQRDDRRVRSLVASELAAPRATGKLLAGLPLVGIVMALAVDADPAGFLLGSVVGQLCVVAATVLTSGGLVWTELIARSGAR